MTGPPGSRMRDRQPLIPDLGQLVYDNVTSNNMLGGTVTGASIANAQKEAFEAMQATGKVGPDAVF